MALDELEDLESMRRRIQEEARIKREYEIQRRRKKATARFRQRLREENGDGDDEDEYSSSSSRSVDLLASSPSPSPPPPRPDDVEDEVDTIKTNSLGGSSIARTMQGPTTSTIRGVTRNQSPSRTNSNAEPKNRGYDDSDSSESDIDMAEVAKCIAGRKQVLMVGGGNSNRKTSDESNKCNIRNRISSDNNNNNTGDSSAVTNLRIPWSDDSSEDDDMIGERKCESHEAIPTVHSGSEMQSLPRETEDEASTRAIGGSVEIITSNMDGTQRIVRGCHLPPLEVKAIHQPSATEHLPKQFPQKAENNVDRTDDDSTKSGANMKTNLPSTGAMEASIKSALDKTMGIDPIIGQDVTHKQSNVTWTTYKQCLLIRSVVSLQPPRDKVAGFDLDHTLVNWRCAGWPSKSEHYELWNSSVIETLRKLYDNEGYSLVIFSNQGGIKTALGGKKAGTIKGIIDWVAMIVGRPLYAIVSTKINSGYHKPNPSVWAVFEEICNYGKEVSPANSFFVGDADGSGDSMANPSQKQHQQTGTDKLFAEKVGEMRNTTMKFYTPGEFFGSSTIDRRRSSTTVIDAPPTLPPVAIRARAALLGGYLNGPICLLLVGVQGSGKSAFCQSLVDAACGDRWAQFSQDTINDGRPGTRQAVESAAHDAILSGKNVVIDRMHLDAEQRQHFVEIGRQCQVPVHCLVILATKEEIEDRVKHRVNHPGNVEGEKGVRIAMASLSRLVLPQYDEGFELINYLWKTDDHLLHSYRHVGNNFSVSPMVKKIELRNAGQFSLPMITFGTFNLKKRESEPIVTQALRLGLTSVDTAPTYDNEKEIGDALKQVSNIIVTIKVPKRAITAEQARNEVAQSLALLQRTRVDIILLHWPCGFIEAGTLSAVWKQLEAMKNEDLCSAIGVCNFTSVALKILLADCIEKPALNQVERHPLLPQHDLIDFCNSQGIYVQAHTALGNGSGLLLKNSVIARIARENKMSPAQGALLMMLVPLFFFSILTCIHIT